MYAYGDLLRTRGQPSGAIGGFVVMVLGRAEPQENSGPQWAVMLLQSPIASIGIDAGEMRTWLQATLDSCERL